MTSRVWDSFSDRTGQGSLGRQYASEDGIWAEAGAPSD